MEEITEALANEIKYLQTKAERQSRYLKETKKAINYKRSLMILLNDKILKERK